MINTGTCETRNSYLTKARHPPISRDEFRSDYAIPKSRQADILLIISDEERDIGRYKSEIRRLQCAVEDLEREQRTLEEQVENRRSYLSILRRVPEELWVEIFSYCLAHLRATVVENEGERFQQDRDWRTLFSAPFTLSHVCVRWRDIIASAPSLWSSVFLNLHWRHAPRTAELYIESSKNQDLDVALHCSGQWDPDIEEEQRMAGALTFQTLFNHMSRFRRLAMFDLQFDVEHLANPTFSRLEYLRIGKSFYPRWFREAVRHAPRLDQVVLEQDAIIPFEMISFSSLRSLEILKLERYAEQLLEIIPTLHNLESLTIARFGAPLREPILPPKKCDSLRSLSVTHFNSSPSTLLQSLELVNLDTLAVDFQRPIDSLDDLVLPFSKLPSLQNLSFSCFIPRPVDKLADIIRNLPNLVALQARLRLYSPAYRTAVSSLLSDLAEDPTIGSRLESLSLIVVHDDITQEILESLVRLLEARCEDKLSSLRDVSLVGDCPCALSLANDITDRLHNVQKKGVDCIVCSLADYYYFPHRSPRSQDSSYVSH
ncbi:hypothetical protein V5O48_003688 [Marasmius crinis-equi]|uniref:F-box domain-containing protein n=1 Tax=Marasmius crinis-equi TaxID=585013 RepID=A0ABR3FS68_9AGAR